MARHRGNDISGNIRSGPQTATLLIEMTLKYGKTCDKN
jgi:hypothetical protein